MKLSFALLALLPSLASAGPAATCSDQAGCFDFTATEVSGSCGGGSCSFEVCMTVNLSQTGCTKGSGTISHGCPRTVPSGQCLTSAFPLSGGDDGVTIGQGYTECYTVGPGEVVEFIMKDGPGCGSGTATSGIGSCQPFSDAYSSSADSCTGGGNYDKECLWSVTAPTTCSGPTPTPPTPTPPTPTPPTPTPPTPTPPTPTPPTPTPPTPTPPTPTPPTPTPPTPTPPSPSPSPQPTVIGGDPHVKQWGSQERKLFHAECDMVFASSKTFHKGAGIDVHVRTTMLDDFSYVESSAVRIGKDVLEVDNKNEEAHFKFNGVEINEADLPFEFGDEFKYTFSGPYSVYKADGVTIGKAKVYQLDLHENGSFITFKTYVKFMTVHIDGHELDFADSVGLSGEHSTGKMVSRSGEVVEDVVAHGLDWQVQHHETMLFSESRSPQASAGEACNMPYAAIDSRKLRRQNRKLSAEAEDLCSKLYPKDVDVCIQDVMLTGDLDVVYSW